MISATKKFTHKPIFTAITLASAVSISTTSYAESNTSELEETLVTATRSNKTTHDALASAEVFSRLELEILQISDLSEIISLNPSADIVRSGGRGSPNTLYTRGTGSTHTLMLINGQRFSSATLGSASFQLIDPAFVHKAEYVKGSRSALYGSDAIGGVLQIFTYGDEEDSEHTLHLDAASNNTYHSALTSRAHIADVQYSVGISGSDSKGYDALENDENLNADDDGFEDRSANVFGRWNYSEDSHISISYLLNESESDYDNSFASDVFHYRQNLVEAAQISVDHALSESVNTLFNIGQSKDESQEFGSTPGFIDTLRYSLLSQTNWKSSETLAFTVGFDFYKENVLTASGIDEYREITDPFLHIDYQPNRFEFNVGIRDNDQQTVSSSLAAGFNINDRIKAYASWAEGFQLPSFNDLYYPELGNSGLKNEESVSSELGLKSQYNHMQWNIAAYQTDVDNLINWAPDDSGQWRPFNVDQAVIKGIELAAKGTLGKVLYEASLSYSEPRDAKTNKILDNRARTKKTFKLGHQLDALQYGIVLLAQSDRTKGSNRSEAYVIGDVYMNVEVNQHLSWGAKITNIGNTRYSLNPTYNTDDRGYKLSLKYRL